MATSKFISQLENLWSQNKFVCVGLDSDYSLIPETIKNSHSVSEAMVTFNQLIIDKTHDLVCAYKLNSAFYEAEGIEGLKALKQTITYIRENTEIPVILDAKRGDIGNTSAAYAKSVFEDLQADAVTVSPYLGEESLKPFLDYQDKGIIVLVKTSNPGGSEFQNILSIDGEPVYQIVAKHIASSWNKNGNCGVVVGATYPEELKQVRDIIGDMPILIPGIGAQGGELEATIKAGKNSKGQGMLIHSARGIIFADDARKATEDLNNQIKLIL